MGARLKTSIVGVTGYTGLEVLRMLLAHPQAELGYLTSRQHNSAPVGGIYPHLAHVDAKITDTPLLDVANDSDVVFLCLPHKTAQEAVAEIHGKTKVIDMSADFRLDDPNMYEKYYGPHTHKELLGEIVYGMPEINREQIKKAQTIANPGCFALLSQLLLYPFKGMIESADIFAVTGSSGAGKSPSDGTHHPVRAHNMKSYNVNVHRHIPEIIRAGGITEEQLNFVPTSGPFTRGIFAQAFITLKKDADAEKLAAAAYKGDPYVRLQDEIALANVLGSNFADLKFSKGNDGRILAQGVLDNLVKGAAGTAVQNMNLMCGLDETTGLDAFSPLYP